MSDQVRGHLDLRSLLAAVETAPPVAAVDVFAAELADRLSAEEVGFLISDFNGSALVRLSHQGRPGRAGRTGATGSMRSDGAESAGRSHGGENGRHRSLGLDAAETVPLLGTPYERVIRTQRPQAYPGDGGTWVLAPVTDRGDVIGVLEMLLPVEPDADTLDYIAAAAHALGYVVIVNRRFTDLFEWGQRSQPFSLAAEIQRRLLPTSLTCEAGQFAVAGAVEPAGNVGGDTFDYSLDRDTLHVSLTDAMGHEEDAALLATLLVGSLRNSRRSGATLVDQAAQANSTLLEHARPGQFVTGQLLRIDLTAGTGAMVNAGHPVPLRLRDGRVESITLAADPPFGIVPGNVYRMQPIALRPGDRVLFVTDGVLERNAATVDIADLVAATGNLHPREVVQELTRAVLGATEGTLRDDATALCLDWYGGGEGDRDVGAGANQHRASPPRAD